MPTPPRARRHTLSRAKVLAGALEVADASGLAGLTIRTLADHLGVRPMALYHHVSGKDEILDALVDAVFAEVDLAAPDGGWRERLTSRCRSLRLVLRRHPWALGLMESRTSPGEATLRHHDAVLGTLRSGGFSVPLTAHAYAVLDAFVYGFVLQEASLPFDGPGGAAGTAQDMSVALTAAAYPHLAELVVEHVLRPGYDFGDEFDRGLDLVLDGLERRREADGGLRPGG